MTENKHDTETINHNQQDDSVVLKMEHLRKSFGNKHVLRDINLKD